MTPQTAHFRVELLLLWPSAARQNDAGTPKCCTDNFKLLLEGALVTVC